MKALYFLIFFAYFDNLSGVSITPDKIVNPAEKVNLVVSTGGKIELTWNKPVCPDFYCYNVYRSDTLTGTYVKINPQKIASQKFVMVYDGTGKKVSGWLGSSTTTATAQYKSPYVVKVLNTPEIYATFAEKKRVKETVFNDFGLAKKDYYYGVKTVNLFGLESEFSNKIKVGF